MKKINGKKKQRQRRPVLSDERRKSFFFFFFSPFPTRLNFNKRLEIQIAQRLDF